MVMTEDLHSLIHQITIEYLLFARNFAIKKIIFARKKKDIDLAFMESTV